MKCFVSHRPTTHFSRNSKKNCVAFDQWFKYSDQQKVELFLFGSSDLSNNENGEISALMSSTF